MSRQYKTSGKHRTQYIYYTAKGEKFVIRPDENGVTEADIALIHSIDDEEVNDQRRYDYRVTAHLDGYGDGEEAGSRNHYLADDGANPEAFLISREDDQAYEEKLQRLGEAMKSLLPQQRTLFEKTYVLQRTNTEIAAEEGVTEAAIRNRLKKMHEKLRKFFP